METYKKQLAEAVELLECVMLQGDELDELQLNILAFLEENGFREPNNPSDYSSMTKKEYREKMDVHKYGRSGIVVYFDWKTSEYKAPMYFNGYKYMIKASTENATQKMVIEAAYDLIVKNEPVPYFMESYVAPTDKDRFKVPISLGFKTYPANTKLTHV